MTTTRKPETVTKYAITCVDSEGLRILALPNQGRNFHNTQQEAESYLAELLANNSADRVALLGKNLDVQPVQCYVMSDGRSGDATRTVFGFDPIPRKVDAKGRLRETPGQTFARVLSEDCTTYPNVLIRKLAARIQRQARILDGIATRQCNGYPSGPDGQAEEERDDSNEVLAEAQIRQIVSLFGDGFSVQFQGDPRGFVVKIILPSKRYNNWGGEAWGVPT